MAEKLSESTWTTFTKKNKLEVDDGALLKALAKFDKTDPSRPEPHEAALDELVEQLKKQVPLLVRKKKELGDKPFTLAKDKVNELLDMAERQVKEAHKARLAASSADEEEDSPALITSKMIPLLRELRKPDVLMHALVCTAGKDTAVLIMRRPIATGRRKLLAEAVNAKGGAKYIVGECLYENNALTFVVQSPAAGLAKRVRAALLAQTALRVKVRVRGDDGQEDEDGDAEAEAGAEGRDEREAVADPLKARYEARTAALADRVADALRRQQGDVGKIRAVNMFATEKGQAGAYAAALQALDALEKLMAPAPAGGGTTPDPGAARPAAAAAPVPPASVSSETLRARLTQLSPRIKQAAADNHPAKDEVLRAIAAFQTQLKESRLAEADRSLDRAQALLDDGGGTGDKAPGGAVDYAKARLAWLGVRGDAQAGLQRLEKAIIAEYQDEPEALRSLTRSVRKLDRVMQVLDESLGDKLDEGLNAADPARRSAVNREARDIIERYVDYLDSDQLVEQIADNPFTPLDLSATLGPTLQALSRQLA